MAQVRIEYLRWITIYLWNCGTPACDHAQEEFRTLNYTTLYRLRESTLAMLKTLTDERYLEFRTVAGVWVWMQEPARIAELNAAFDNARFDDMPNTCWKPLPERKAA